MILRLLALLTLAISITGSQVTAQCTPDLSITVPGVYPDSATGLPPGTVGVPYSEVIQVKVLTDTSQGGFPVVITSITITGVTGLPPGLTYSCNPSNCIFPGGSNGCILLSGTPSVAGTFMLNVDVSVAGTVFGNPLPPQSQSIDYYSITIDAASGLAPGLANVKFELLQNKPNPAVSFTDVQFTSPVGGDFKIKVFNMIGKEVYNQTIRGMAGLNTSRIETEYFTPGIYMISIEHGTDVITRRMIVSRK